MFPVPLPHPGYYPANITDFVACVPPAACPGVDATAIETTYSQLRIAGSADVDNLLALFAAVGGGPGGVRQVFGCALLP
jgi:hypothetical protein